MILKKLSNCQSDSICAKEQIIARVRKRLLNGSVANSLSSSIIRFVSIKKTSLKSPVLKSRASPIFLLVARIGL